MINIKKGIIVLMFTTQLVYAQNQDDTYQTDVITSKSRAYAGWVFEGLTGLHTIYQPEEFLHSFYTFGIYSKYAFYAPIENFSVSVGSPTSLGLDFFIGSFGNFYGILLNVPVMFDVNFGALATPKNNKPVGIFGGAGVNFNYAGFTVNGNGINFTTFGPKFHAGFKWTRFGTVQGLRLGYTYNFPKSPETANGIIIENPSNSRYLISISYSVSLF